ncbi:Vacuolar ATPase assembly protein [Komagataella phaffii CBS 7435]|uniref:Vacuolar ATPase assembly protein VMA22 n=2 Tax=Komagataella phaffii TaxID=460519 RepID=C4QWP1_KOMPG|nr:uncharacterized protein PAS_chr1-1_0493 [Komagataella phaffii GS115]AOA60782.1 GQ67_02872T0 [Komagataella phaffii]CAH2446410.1 Vacuolar ATPase assembly protein [Komagataella phaffii CBS 7435]AOA65687.1 GQ68_02375T0 [Komagataella phaffii GS115]CAY67664.1 hypothetical protein PAS_chr1-1_0493 [Komagataella phaffii GS115]CCA36757.1 Vacuolar ATPase assembly protein [Komagataella phaffii CBS 7435]
MTLELDIKVEELSINPESGLNLPLDWEKPVIPENYNQNGSQGVRKEIDEQSAKLILLLNLIDEYERNLVGICDKLEAGFLQLSRAKFYNPNRFDSSYYDLRELKAQSQFKDGKLSMQEAPKPGSKSEEKEKEKEAEVSTLRNRHQKSLKTVKEEKLDEKSKNSSFKDPIKMFGAILPASLYESQAAFKQALKLLVEKKRLVAEMSVLFDRIEEIEMENAKAESKDKDNVQEDDSPKKHNEQQTSV